MLVFGGMCFPCSPVRGQTRRKELLGKSWPGGASAGRMVGRGPSGEGAEQPPVDEAQLLPQGQEGGTLLRVAAPALQHDAVDLGRAEAGPGKAVAPGDLPYGFLVCHSCKEGEDAPESDVPKGCPAVAKMYTGGAVKWCLSARGVVEERMWEIQTNFLPPAPAPALQPLNIPPSHPLSEQ